MTASAGNPDPGEEPENQVATDGPGRRESFVALLWRRFRASLLKMWRVRGGGFYGFGFVVYFVGAQFLSLLSDVADATGPIDFLTGQVLESVIRLIGDTPVNFLTALLWPLKFLSWLGSAGLLVLLACFIGFDRWLKPWLNQRFGLVPEPPPEDPSPEDPSE